MDRSRTPQPPFTHTLSPTHFSITLRRHLLFSDFAFPYAFGLLLPLICHFDIDDDDDDNAQTAMRRKINPRRRRLHFFSVRRLSFDLRVYVARPIFGAISSSLSVEEDPNWNVKNITLNEYIYIYIGLQLYDVYLNIICYTQRRICWVGNRFRNVRSKIYAHTHGYSRGH